jgi:glycerol-3-phosphate dehydrogenase (NAD(P)+)
MSAVAVLGGGAWGGVLAAIAARHGHDVALWEIDHASALALQRTRASKRSVPGFKLPPEVAVFSGAERAEAVASRDLLVVAVPSGDVAMTMMGVAAERAGTPPPVVVCASKGLEPERGNTMAEVIARSWPAARVAILSGPSFAAEIARGLPAALVAASIDRGVSAAVQACFGGDRLRVYTSTDVTGVCVGGALKNVIAIAVGCCDGFGLGDNARAALITRGLAEMARLALAKGAKAETLMGLSGLGDLTLTCSGLQSRNLSLGIALGKGEELAQYVASRRSIAEGVASAAATAALAKRLGIDMPIVAGVDAILHRGAAIDSVIEALLARPFRAEALG